MIIIGLRTGAKPGGNYKAGSIALHLLRIVRRSLREPSVGTNTGGHAAADATVT